MTTDKPKKTESKKPSAQAKKPHAKTGAAKSAPAKPMPAKPTSDAPTSEKLQKVLARAGLGSRREMETAIEAGRASVNGKVAKLGDRVTAKDRIMMDGRAVETQATYRRVLVYNKPEGEVCTRQDPEGRPTVFDRLPPAGQGRWISIGRLDINTSGLLLLTTDGELANRLMHPSSQVEREYAVRVLGAVNPDMVKAMHEGVMLEDGLARFTDIQEFGGSGANVWFHVVIMEGRNREVRRLWESQGVKVSRLKRVRYGNVFMDSDLRMGQWKELDQKVIDNLAASVDLPPVKLPSLDHKTQEQTERLQKKRAGVGVAAKPVKPAGRRRASMREDTTPERVKRGRR